MQLKLALEVLYGNFDKRLGVEQKQSLRPCEIMSIHVVKVSAGFVFQ